MLEIIKDYLNQKNKLWKIIMIISIVLFLLVLTVFIWRLFPGLSSKKNTETALKDPNTQASTSEAPQICAGCIRRLIDGVYVAPEKANLPPVAVMLDNHPSARPQAGIEKANLVYEAEVEGNYTRFMAIFASGDDIKQIGAVRSGRSYFVDWAQEINAVYAHCGGSP